MNKLWDKLRRKLIRWLGGIPKNEIVMPERMIRYNLKPVSLTEAEIIDIWRMPPDEEFRRGLENRVMIQVAEKIGKLMLEKRLVVVEKSIHYEGIPTERIKVSAWVVPWDQIEETIP